MARLALGDTFTCLGFALAAIHDGDYDEAASLQQSFWRIRNRAIDLAERAEAQARVAAVHTVRYSTEDGVHVARFSYPAEAKRFANGRRLDGRECKVESLQ
jgi:hypothetical protein